MPATFEWLGRAAWSVQAVVGRPAAGAGGVKPAVNIKRATAKLISVLLFFRHLNRKKT
jgi:hypothetical protein